MKSKRTGGVLDTVMTVVYAVLIAIFVRTVAYEPFNIPSGSMMPTLLIGDYLFVSKFSYGYSKYSLPMGLPLFSGRLLFSEPKRGDVVVFKLPRDGSTDYIKRLIGLPGDKIQVKDGLLYINEVPVKREQIENYVDPSGSDANNDLQYMETLPNGVRHRILQHPRPHDEIARGGFDPDNTQVYVVPPGHYFMMGDNRDNSLDSRFPMERGVGFVPAENLIGRADFLFFSTNGAARIWEFWKWPFAIRYDRPFHGVH